MMTVQEFIAAIADSLLPRLPALLQAYWVLASSAVLLTLLPLPIVPSAFKAAVKLAASRGKLWHDRPDAKALGFLKDVSVPQQYFEHFYLVGSLVTTVLLQVYIFVCTPDTDGSTLKRDSLLALFLFELHVLRRYGESNYVMHYPETARMHLLAYLFGLSYYVVAPLTLLPAFVMDVGVLRGAWDQALGGGKDLAGVDERLYAAVLAPHPGKYRLAGALALYVFASILQFVSHLSLARMSREASQRATEFAVVDAINKGNRAGVVGAIPTPAGVVDADGKPLTAKVVHLYEVPRGGVFNLVSCPHYLAEILIYAALALVTSGSTGSLLMAGWVFLNLVLAAAATQRFYRTRYPNDYPKSRAALIPFIL
ncbi:hypothetical protein CHLRE_17g720950v5 [Chlamydomonas reinhardtii]|uniref:3-oxo-5-alpha-steroid 4-dehydrogenase C-terminal domain-containing protein n=1 Tax=Chlamydomonas reinhardtii TaxID=3055 RepID=A8J6E6_CHLRE|nr:uncharacterized protein CHLRE_17g720950v5 [Chlamydomonas reinhardtii]PNW70466.1 hypothetical protein CHLRE_17g720950v5 [Chlamydomonas reinhardtii]|eukprot:XP_001697111.1 predicted protein [Chlamydomonas reinhardtii]